MQAKEEKMDFVSFLLFLGSFILCTNFWQGKTSLSDYFELKKSQKNLEETVTKLKFEIKDLEAELYKIKSSRDYARKILKDRYHLTSENERILFFEE